MTRRRRAPPGPGDASRADAPIGLRTPDGLDPFGHAVVIAGADGVTLLDVPFDRHVGGGAAGARGGPREPSAAQDRPRGGLAVA